MQTTPPLGAALFKIVAIKSADYPNLTPDKDFGDRIFWYDPDPYGHSSGLREVYPQPSPIVIGEIMSAVIEQAKRPTADMHHFTVEQRLNLIDRAEHIRAQVLIRAHRLLRGERENAIEPGRLLTEAQRASLFEGDLSEVAGVMLAASVIDHPAEITGQNDRSDFQQHRGDVKERSDHPSFFQSELERG